MFFDIGKTCVMKSPNNLGERNKESETERKREKRKNRRVTLYPGASASLTGAVWESNKERERDGDRK